MIDFTDMTLDEKKMILNWRNDNTIKQWMYDTTDISLESHLNYINSLESSKTKQYMAVKKENQYIGVVYFTNIDFKNKSTYFGLYANPFEKIAGVGRILEEICIKYAFDMLKLSKLKLEVFSDNKKALNLYKKYKFEKVDTKIINSKDVICMELNKNAI